MLEREPSEATRENIRRTILVLKNESRLVRSMRERLVKAHRDGDREEIKDIHDFIKGKQEYNSDKQI